MEPRIGAVQHLRLELARAEHVPLAVGKLELVQVGAIPAGEGEVNRSGEVGERVPRSGDHHPGGSPLEHNVSPREQLHSNRQPPLATHGGAPRLPTNRAGPPPP